MMRATNVKDMEDLELQVRPWLEERGIPLCNYRRISLYYKKLLYKLVCLWKDNFTDCERRYLYRQLVHPESRGTTPCDPVDSKTDKELREFFSPPNFSQGKLCDWGGE